MKIKRVSKFLTVATFLLSGGSSVFAADQITSSIFKDLSRSMGSVLSPTSLDGRNVMMFEGKLKNESKTSHSQAFGENYTVVGHFEGESACIVFTESPSLKDSKIIFDTKGKEFLVFDADAYALHLIVHETTHCLNHDFKESVQQITDLLNKSELKEYESQIRALDVAIRETHSDLISALVGASQSGDWKIFRDVILPLRTTSYRPTHTTSLSVYSIIKDINPMDLKKLSSDEVFELGNILFSKSFYKDGIVDLHSPGVNNILQEWAATAHEQLYVASLSRTSNHALLKNIRSYLEFADIQLGNNTYNYQSASTTYALKQIALESQYSNINKHADDFANRGYSNRLKSLVRSSSSVIAKMSYDNRHKMNGSGDGVKDTRNTISIKFAQNNKQDSSKFDYAIEKKIKRHEMNTDDGLALR